jgi:hypothetical protein
MLQYADDLVVYASHVDDVENVQRTVQFANIGLSILESKSELMLFSRKHTNPSVCVTLNGQCLSVVPEFRYLGVVYQKTSMGRTRALHAAQML